ncbi:MAG TPA: sugar transferase, partial [Bryobacteraceae bacterium]|nr:sugar transferase [Bryobacteraceae bacterium]
VFIPTSVVALLLSEIILLCLCFVVALVFVMDVDPEYVLLYDGGAIRIAIAVFSILIGLYFQDLYTELRIRSRIFLVQQFMMALGLAFLAQAMTTYVNPALILPRWVMIYASGLILIVLPFWRVLFFRQVLTSMHAPSILLLGTSPVLGEISQRLQERIEMGFRVAGYLDDGASAPGKSLSMGGAERLGLVSELRRIVDELKPDRIVVGMAERRAQLPVNDLLELRLSGVHVEEAAGLYESCFGRVSTRNLRPSQLVFSSELGPSRHSVSIQQIYSFLVALIGGIVSLPLMILAAILVRLTSKGPILYRQTRVGLNGRHISVLKFRSMFVDAEARTGAVWASKNDPRITGIGKYLRKFRIDELPQFWNVLRGDMSFVGPRPERPEFVQALSEKIPFYRQRHCVKPGLTGWAQINHKYGDTIEDTITKLEYDLYYIKHISFSLDMYIILNTLKTVLLGRGAQ